MTLWSLLICHCGVNNLHVSLKFLFLPASSTISWYIEIENCLTFWCQLMQVHWIMAVKMVYVCGFGVHTEADETAVPEQPQVIVFATFQGVPKSPARITRLNQLVCWFISFGAVAKTLICQIWSWYHRYITQIFRDIIFCYFPTDFHSLLSYFLLGKLHGISSCW